MYGIIIEVNIEPNREEEARTMINNMVVPKAKSHLGIVGGYFLKEVSGNILRVIELYDTENNAKQTAERIQSEGPPPDGPVKLVSVNIYEVIAQI